MLNVFKGRFFVFFVYFISFLLSLLYWRPFGDTLLTVVRIFTFHCVIIKIQLLSGTKWCKITLTCCSVSTLCHNGLIWKNQYKTLNQYWLYLYKHCYQNNHSFCDKWRTHISIKLFLTEQINQKSVAGSHEMRGEVLFKQQDSKRNLI